MSHIRTIEIQVYSIDGKHIVHRARKTAPPGHRFKSTDETAEEMVRFLDTAYPGNCWHIIEVRGFSRNTQILKFIWDENEPWNPGVRQEIERKLAAAMAANRAPR